MLNQNIQENIEICEPPGSFEITSYFLSLGVVRGVDRPIVNQLYNAYMPILIHINTCIYILTIYPVYKHNLPLFLLCKYGYVCLSDKHQLWMFFLIRLLLRTSRPCIETRGGIVFSQATYNFLQNDVRTLLN